MTAIDTQKKHLKIQQAKQTASQQLKSYERKEHMYKHRNRNQNRSVDILNVDLETIGIEEAALKSKIIDATKQQIYDLAAGATKKTTSVGRNWNHNTVEV